MVDPNESKIKKLDPGGVLLMHQYGEDFPWEEVDERIIEYLKRQVQIEGPLNLEDSGAPGEAIEKFNNLVQERWVDD